MALLFEDKWQETAFKREDRRTLDHGSFVLTPEITIKEGKMGATKALFDWLEQDGGTRPWIPHAFVV